MGSIAAVVIYAVVAVAAAVISNNSAPEPPDPPKPTDPILDKTQLQDEQELKELTLGGESDERRRLRKGKSAFIQALDDEAEAAAQRDPGGVQLDSEASSGVQTTTGVSQQQAQQAILSDNPTTNRRTNQTGGVQI